MIYVLIALLFTVGLYGLFAKRHVVKKILGLAIIEYAINLFLVAVGYRDGGRPPILTGEDDATAFVAQSVDPLPQALVLTSIVIGLGVIMLLVALALRLYERHGTLDTTRMNQLHG
jgi:multicomponent Na+:H+ antiporter subunit C